MPVFLSVVCGKTQKRENQKTRDDEEEEGKARQMPNHETSLSGTNQVA
jgi:hypothetical protein|tara:strand:+ start:844 stop:987 length:144 start_codon:yes stop_codon:yes gene_type:complete